MGKQRHIELIARGLLIESEHLLVCRNLRSGYGFLPGGHVEFDEAAAAALRREFAEETGVQIRVEECLLVTEEAFSASDQRHHEVNLVFHVERLGPTTAIRSLETKIGFEWLPLADLAKHDLRPTAISTWIRSRGVSRPTAAWKSGMSA